MNGATVYQINVSGGGVPKLPVTEAVVGELGIDVADLGPVRQGDNVQLLKEEGHG